MSTREERFQAPPARYRGKPFWSWNGKLEQKELLRQIDILKEMGMGGYFCHSRTGLATEYLGEEWFSCINASADHGKALGMETWLYDEDRWPSGTAGGRVTANPAFRMRFLRLEILPAEAYTYGDAVAAFTAEVDGFSFTNKHRLTPTDRPTKGTVLKFTVEEMEKSTFYNGYTYVDTMNPEATACFLEETHEKYRAHCGERLGDAIHGIFIDEPHRGPVMCNFGIGNRDAQFLTPYTPQLFERFAQQYGCDLRDHLPELYLWKDGEKLHPIKWQYMELLQEMFEDGFMKPVLAWCREHSLKLTGHLLHEDSLIAQSCMIGSILRGYAHMDIPGVDTLFEHNRNFWLTKQLQSVSRQLQKPDTLCEMYAGMGWQTSFQSFKAAGDWHALFGVNLRCHHLSWYTMAGEAKRDFPPSINRQSAWYPHFHYVEDYFSRLHVFLEGGEPVCSLLVLDPVESLWARIYPGWSYMLISYDDEVNALEAAYEQIFHILCGAKIDFDYGDENILRSYARVETDEKGPLLRVGAAVYRRVLVPPTWTIRRSTLELLADFAAKGGRVIFAGGLPQYIDAQPSALPDFPRVEVPLEPASVLAQVHGAELVEVRNQAGDPLPEVYAQMYREEDGAYRLLLMNLNREEVYPGATVRIPFGGYAEEWDARTGQIFAAGEGAAAIDLSVDIYPLTEKLYRITPVKRELPTRPHQRLVRESSAAQETYAYRLTEPNVAVLDTVRLTIDGEDIGWQEVLKADQLVRQRYGLDMRNGEMIQPWFAAHKPQPVYGTVSLTYPFTVETMPPALYVAVETPEAFRITVNGRQALKKTDREWVDTAFHVLEIAPDALVVGENLLQLETDFREDCNLEALYLLGEFGVRLEGTRSVLMPLPDRVRIGDLCEQGFPFYGADILYEVEQLPAIAQGESLRVAVDAFGAACLRVEETGAYIAFQPFTADATACAGGTCQLRCALTRRNTFGPHHQVPNNTGLVGPANFITGGTEFDPHRFGLMASGLLSAPRFTVLSARK